MFQKDKCVAALHEELINPPHGFLSLDGFLFLLSCLLIMSSTSCCSPITLSCLSWGFNYLFQLFFPCLFSSSRLFLHADVFSKWQGRLSSSTHSFIKQVCYIFSAFSPLWDTLWWNRKDMGGKGRVRGPRKAENDLPKSQKARDEKKQTTLTWQERFAKICLSDRLTGYWEYSVTARTVCLFVCVCLHAFLQGFCLCVGVCVSVFFFFFSFPCVFGFGLRQLLVVILFSHPPTQRATVLVRFSVGETALCLPLLLYRHCRINFS